MSSVTLATGQADAHALEAIEAHHAELQGALALRVDALRRAVGRKEPETPARRELVTWCESELVPHATAEEAVLYPPAHDRSETRLLVRAMSGEHDVLTGLVARLAAATDPVEALSTAVALQVLFETHVAKENDLLLPALAATVEISLAGLLERMHETLESAHGNIARTTGPSTRAAAADQPDAPAGHACGCHEHDADHPELDVRVVPHAIRHATVFGALDAVAPGAGMVLVAPHDPVPLLEQIDQRHHGAIEVEYLQRGPDAWRLLLTRGR